MAAGFINLPDRNGDEVVAAKDERILLPLPRGQTAVVELHSASAVTLLVLFLLVAEARLEAERRQWTCS